MITKMTLTTMTLHARTRRRRDEGGGEGLLRSPGGDDDDYETARKGDDWKDEAEVLFLALW